MAAAIERINISATEVAVAVRGRNVTGTRLEIAGLPGPRSETRFGIPEVQYLAGGFETGSLAVKLQTELPRTVWVVLSRGNEWLDHRRVDNKWSPFAHSQDGVTIEPPDLPTQVQAYIYQGEGVNI